MKQFDYTITDPLGIHARPAGMVAKTAKELGCKVTITKNGKTADTARMMALMGLGIKTGDTVTITVEGGDEEHASQVMEKFFRENL